VVSLSDRQRHLHTYSQALIKRWVADKSDTGCVAGAYNASSSNLRRGWERTQGIAGVDVKLSGEKISMLNPYSFNHAIWGYRWHNSRYP
jgi:hypothetical protein